MFVNFDAVLKQVEKDDRSETEASSDEHDEDETPHDPMAGGDAGTQHRGQTEYSSR